MVEVNTAEAEANADAAFGAGFDGSIPAVIPSAKAVEEPKTEAVAQPPVATPAPKPEKPQYARVLEKDWNDLKAKAGQISVLESAIAKLTGSMPKADAIIQQVVEKVRAETPAGLAVEFLKEDFAELSEDYPELVERLERLLNKAKVKGTAPTTEAAKPAAGGVMDQEAIDKAVEATLTKRAQKEAADKRDAEVKALNEAFPDWGKIVGQPVAMGTRGTGWNSEQSQGACGGGPLCIGLPQTPSCFSWPQWQ